MINTILGTKQEMSAVFNPAGIRIPVTAVMADPNVIVGFKDTKVIIGFGRRKKSKKTENAQVKAVGYAPRIIKEISTKQENTSNKANIGDKITVSIFKPGDQVKVTGITKGRGFAGVVKRWGFAGGPKTHGQSDRHRAPGSIGAGTTPGRVFRGKKMAGHMGNARLTVTRLEIIEVNKDKNLILVKGSIPGHKNGILIIEKTGEVKRPAMTQTQVAEVSPTSPAPRVDAGAKRGEQIAKENKGDKTATAESKSVPSVVSGEGKQNAS